jgi:transposase-like protein
MERQAVIKNLPEALQVVKEMNLASQEEWTGEYRDTARAAIGTVLKEQMEGQIAGHLSWAYQKGIPDRRNGSYTRHVLTELGNLILAIPRTRCFSPRGILAAYARRTRKIDHLILACFLLGLSTRKVGVALLPLLGEKISAQTVSRVAQTLNDAVTAFHRRRITSRFRALILDGISIKKKDRGGHAHPPGPRGLGHPP